jgi:hypothetical protein
VSYKITGHDGASLEVAECCQGEHGFLSVSDGDACGSACVDPLEIPGLTAALYEAAGQKPPVMLGRPDIDPQQTGALGRFGMWLDDGQVVLAFSRQGTATLASDPVSPAFARQLAAMLVVYADAADTPDVDPAEVAELAAVIAGCPEGTESARAEARIILLAGYRREGGR